MQSHNAEEAWHQSSHLVMASILREEFNGFTGWGGAESQGVQHIPTFKQQLTAGEKQNC